MRNSFDLRVEPGAHLQWEWRDAPELNTAYAVGPRLEVLPDGTLRAAGRRLLKLPHNTWAHLEIVCLLGPQASGKYRVDVVLPGQTPAVFADIPYQADFKVLRWVGFISASAQPACYWVDNLSLGIASGGTKTTRCSPNSSGPVVGCLSECLVAASLGPAVYRGRLAHEPFEGAREMFQPAESRLLGDLPGLEIRLAQ